MDGVRTDQLDHLGTSLAGIPAHVHHQPLAPEKNNKLPPKMDKAVADCMQLSWNLCTRRLERSGTDTATGTLRQSCAS